jgi:hypothetical protein
MRVKIQPDSVGLCGTCREAQVTEFSNGRREVRCHSRGTRPILVTSPVVKCNDFDDKASPSQWEMQKIAWVVATDRSGNAIGFKAPPKTDD